MYIYIKRLAVLNNKTTQVDYSQFHAFECFMLLLYQCT